MSFHSEMWLLLFVGAFICRPLCFLGFSCHPQPLFQPGQGFPPTFPLNRVVTSSDAGSRWSPVRPEKRMEPEIADPCIQTGGEGWSFNQLEHPSVWQRRGETTNWLLPPLARSNKTKWHSELAIRVGNIPVPNPKHWVAPRFRTSLGRPHLPHLPPPPTLLGTHQPHPSKQQLCSTISRLTNRNRKLESCLQQEVKTPLFCHGSKSKSYLQ